VAVAPVVSPPPTFTGLVRVAQGDQRLLAVDEADNELSFDGYTKQVAEVAAALADRGVAVGTRVAWQLPTRLETLVLVGALAELGATQIPILPTHRQREVGFILAQARPDLFVIPETWQGFDYRAMAAQLVGSKGPELLVCDERLPRRAGASLPPADADVGDADDLRWIFYTSGTTSEPKGVRHCDRSILAAAIAVRDPMDVRATDRMSLVFPVSHIGGVIWLAITLMTRCAVLVTDKFRPEETTAFLSRRGVTLAGAGTAFHLAYLNVQARTPGNSIFPGVRGFPSGAGPKPPSLHSRLKREIGGVGVLSGYGLTECPNLVVTPYDSPDEELATTEGKPTPGVQLKIAGPDGECLSVGTEGEIRVRAPQLFAGYLDPSLDGPAFDEDGFFRTGDLGVLDAAGFLRITGRIKDVIIRKGENISAKEIEDLLFDHPAVADVAVVGVADPETGERCAAVLVAKAGHEPLDLPQIAAYLSSHGLAQRKFPELITWVDALPRDPSGKVRKVEIRQSLQAVTAGERR